MDHRKFYKVTFICATESDVTLNKLTKYVKKALDILFKADPAKIKVEQLQEPQKKNLIFLFTNFHFCVIMLINLRDTFPLKWRI